MARNRHSKPGKGFWTGKCNKCGSPVTKRMSVSIYAVSEGGKEIRVNGKLPRICTTCNAPEPVEQAVSA